MTILCITGEGLVQYYFKNYNKSCTRKTSPVPETCLVLVIV